MKKNIIIIVLIVLAAFLGVYANLQFTEANMLKAEVIKLSEQVTMTKERSERLSDEAMKQAAKATINEANCIAALEKLKLVETQLENCK